MGHYSGSAELVKGALTIPVLVSLWSDARGWGGSIQPMAVDSAQQLPEVGATIELRLTHRSGVWEGKAILVDKALDEAAIEGIGPAPFD